MAGLLDPLKKKQPTGLLDPVSNVVQQETWNREEIPLWSPEGDAWGERSIAGLNQSIANIAGASNAEVSGAGNVGDIRRLLWSFSRTLEGTGFDADPQAFLNLFKRYMTPEQYRYFIETGKPDRYLKLKGERGWKPLDEQRYYDFARQQGYWDIVKPWVSN